ncbi:MAG: CBS domain-containing protein [Isosphaeraceae bacterium]
MAFWDGWGEEGGTSGNLDTTLIVVDDRIGIGVATKEMHDGSFSQLPVYSGNTLMGLLTSETVLRWLAAQLADGQGILEERPVQEVMRHEEGTHSHVAMGRSATVDDAFSEFDEHVHAGKVLDAIIMTHNGSKRERPVGMVTATDQPKLRSAIRV